MGPFSDDDNGTTTDDKKGNNAKETNSSNVDPATVGVNLYGSNYIGSHNPKDKNGNWSYALPPQSILDAFAKDHDQAYDRAHVSGVSGVLFSTSVVNADYKLVGNSFAWALNPLGIVSPQERMESLSVGIAIGIAALPKTIFYGLAIAGESIKP